MKPSSNNAQPILRDNGSAHAAMPGERRSLWSLLKSKAFRPGVRQGVVVLFDQGLCGIGTLLTGVLVARGCGANKAEFGLYVLGMTLVFTVQGFRRALVSVPFTVLSPRLGDRERAAYFGSTLVQQLGISALTVAGFGGAAGVLYAMNRGGVAAVMLAISVASVGILLQDFMRSALLAELRVWTSLVMGAVARGTTVGALGLAYALGHLNVVVAYLIVAVCSGLPAAIVLWRERKRLALVRQQIACDLKRNFRIGRWLVASNVAYMCTRQALPWFLVFVWGGEQLAVLGVCRAAAGLIGYMSRGLASFFLPKMSQVASSEKRLARIVKKSVSLLIVVGVGYVVLVGWLAGDRMVTWLYSDVYSGLGGLITLCFINAAIVLVDMPISHALHALKRSDVVFKGLLAGVPVMLSVGVVLTWKMGVWGVCLATLLSSLVSLTYRARYLSARLSSAERPEGARQPQEEDQAGEPFHPEQAL